MERISFASAGSDHNRQVFGLSDLNQGDLCSTEIRLYYFYSLIANQCKALSCRSLVRLSYLIKHPNLYVHLIINDLQIVSLQYNLNLNRGIRIVSQPLSGLMRNSKYRQSLLCHI